MTLTMVSIAQVEVDCPTCGFTWWVAETFRDRRRGDGRTFYCPSGGHTLSYRETEVDRLNKQLAMAQGRLSQAEGTITHLRDQYDSAQRSRAALKGQVTQMRKRVGNGVCPCCSRTFKDLARHMSGQHPDFAEAAS